MKTEKKLYVRAKIDKLADVVTFFKLLVPIIKILLLLAFFIGAVVFIYKQMGWWIFGAFFGIAVLFSPMWLTRPANFISRNIFTDPTYKRWRGNLFNRDK